MATRTLAERMAAGKPEVFKFENVGDLIIGEIEAISARDGDYGPYNVLTILNNEDGNAYSVAMFGGVLKGKFADLDPAVGMQIAIRYEGEKPSKVRGHQDYRDFWVELDEATRPASKPRTVAAPVAVTSETAAPSVEEDNGEEPF